jgi:hypothetical protein
MAAKPQPWYASLNQPPWSPKDGRNRRPSASTYHCAPNRTDPTVDPGKDDTFTITVAQWRTITAITFPTYKPPEIPYAGIRAGEIIGYRMWLIFDDLQLCSIAHKFIWKPQAVIEGKIDEPVKYDPLGFYKPIMGGVYSYANWGHLQAEANQHSQERYPRAVRLNMFSFYPITLHGIAIGTIKCWGEVIEHEKGYRAQYAKLQSIDTVIGPVDIDKLRARYVV